MTSTETFTYVDLFAGCGGLSLGLEAQGAKLILAVEKSSMASESFFENFIHPSQPDVSWEQHLNSNLEDQLGRGLAIADIRKVLPKVTNLPFLVSGGNIDLVAGGPPCQGFSLAGKRNAEDVRNTLPLDFLKFVKAMTPKFVIIENVVGMSHKFEKDDDLSPFESLATALEKLQVHVGEDKRKYVVQRVRANAAHYGAAQNRERMFLIAARSDVATALGISTTRNIWRSGFIDKVSQVPDLAPQPTIEANAQQTVADALCDFINGGDSSYTKILKDAKLWGLTPRSELCNTGLRNHSKGTKTKFALMHLIKSKNLSPALLKTNPTNKERQDLKLQKPKMEGLDYPISLGEGLPEISSANSLRALLAKHKTAKHSQRVVNLNAPAPTIVTSADDYIHPIEPRAMSVRELSRFQGFPDMFVFCSKETTGGLKRRTEVPQYSQVGNAVSPFMALALGKLISNLVGEYESQRASSSR